MNIAPADKAAARRHFLARRRELPTALRRFAAASVARTLSPLLPQIPWLLAYRPMGSELSVSAILAEARALGLEVTLPGMHDDPSDIARRLGGAWQVPKVPLALLPGIAFDPQGTRLGRGAGFYDRLLALLPEAVVRIGVGFSCQVTAHVSRHAHDMPVDALLTERGLLLCGDCRPAVASWLSARGHAWPDGASAP